jgi:DNA replication licensing factor MCM4
MSSPPALDFPSSDDIDMENGTGSASIEPSMSGAPRPQALPLFFPGDSFNGRTPVRQRASNAPDSTPLRGIMARRAVGMATPKGTPIFARESRCSHSLKLMIDATDQQLVAHLRWHSPAPRH